MLGFLFSRDDPPITPQNHNIPLLTGKFWGHFTGPCSDLTMSKESEHPTMMTSKDRRSGSAAMSCMRKSPAFSARHNMRILVELS